MHHIITIIENLTLFWLSFADRAAYFSEAKVHRRLGREGCLGFVVYWSLIIASKQWGLPGSHCQGQTLLFYLGGSVTRLCYGSVTTSTGWNETF